MIGWIKLHRSNLQSGILRNHRLFTFLCYLQLKAAHEETIATVGLQKVHLNPGECVFGREKAGQDLALSPRQVRVMLDALKRANKVAVKATNKFSIITLLDWHVEQHVPRVDDQQSASNAPATRPTTGHIQEIEARPGNNEELTAINPDPAPANGKSNLLPATSPTEDDGIKIYYNYSTFEFTGIGPEIAIWRSAYPSIDIDAEILKAASWLASNPKNPKSDYKRFINYWLVKAQDRAQAREGSKNGKRRYIGACGSGSAGSPSRREGGTSGDTNPGRGDRRPVGGIPVGLSEADYRGDFPERPETW